jgi:hypothetical protein
LCDQYTHLLGDCQVLLSTPQPDPSNGHPAFVSSIAIAQRGIVWIQPS